MSNTYHKITIHTIAVKFRKGTIQAGWEGKLYAVIGNLINESGRKPILINGVEDHVHCFFHAKPSVAISQMMKSTKAKSSKWINENNLLRYRFQWLSGFGCFLYGQSQRNDVYQYIANQKESYLRYFHLGFDIHTTDFATGIPMGKSVATISLMPTALICFTVK